MATMIGATNLEQDSESSSPFSIASKLWRVSNETPLSHEQELARYSLQKWEEMEECQRKIQYYQGKLEVLAQELQVFSLLTRLSHGPTLWYGLPDDLKDNKEVARAILHNGNPPMEFQEMLWGDPNCELRQDRDILLASLEQMADEEFHCRVLLSDKMKNDKELMCKLTEKHACHLLLVQDDVTAALCDDENVFRALLIVGDGAAQSSKWGDNLALLNKFSPRLRNNADLMLETILTVRCYEYRPEKEHFVGGYLRDSKQFCLRIADALLRLSEDDRRYCPLQFRHLSERLRLDPDVASAFCKVDGSNLILALEMRRASQRKAKFNSTFMQSNSQISKESVLRAFEGGEYDLNFLDFYDNLPMELLQDRDLAVKASLCMSLDIFESDHLKEFWFHDRDYWFHFVDACDDYFEAYWRKLPSELQEDRELALFIARKADFAVGSASSAFQELFEKFPDFVLDREVIVNLLKNDELEHFVEMIPREVFDKDFCLYLLQISVVGANVILPDELYGERDVVIAFCHGNPLSLLSHEVQLRYPDLVAEVIRNNSELGLALNDIPEALRLSNREVVLALISTGFRIHVSQLSPELGNDRDVFLAFAEHHVEGFWNCPATLLQDKEFMLQVVKKNPQCLQYVDASLWDDFDILLATFSCDQDHARHFLCQGGVEDSRAKRIAAFARKIRERLQSFLSFLAFLEGMISTRSVSPPSSTFCCCALSLLDQGVDTALAYKKLIAAYAGIPLGEELCMLQRASVGLTRWGY